MTPHQYASKVSRLQARLRRPAIEGRLAALLLAYGTPLTLSEAADLLSVSKPVISVAANAMAARGDLIRSRARSTREHVYELPAGACVRDLRDVLEASREQAKLSAELAERRDSEDPEGARRLREHAELHRKAAAALAMLVRPLMEEQAYAVKRHEERDWDAVPPKWRAASV